MRTTISLIAAYVFFFSATLVPSGAQAANVDLWMKYDDAQTQVVWCSDTDDHGHCASIIFFSVRNITAQNTIAHVYVGASDDDCQFEVVGASRVNSEHGWLNSIGYALSMPHIGYYGGSWDQSWKLAQQPINGNRELYFAVQLGFPPTHSPEYWMEQCPILIEVRPASNDSDVNTAGAGHVNWIWFNITD